jgi:hypothetical protein
MILEGALGRHLLGKKREPLDVSTMRQASRRAALSRSRVAAQRPVSANAPTKTDRSRHGVHPVADAIRAAKVGMMRSGSSVKGTPTHMSPEQVRGEKSDVPNPHHPEILGGGAKRQAQKLARHSGISSVACKGPSGTYSSSKGCAKGHQQLGSRVHPSTRRPSIQEPRTPAPARTQKAMRRAGAHQALT